MNTIKAPGRLRQKLEEMFTTSQFTLDDIIKMYIPLVLDQLFIYVINMLSVSMVSSSGQEAISAVSMVGSLSFMVMAVFQALAMGGTVVVAQAKGSGNPDRVRSAAGQTLFITTLVSVVCSVVLIVFCKPIVTTLFHAAEPILIDNAVTYLFIYSFSFTPFALFNAITCVFRGLGDSKSCLAQTIIINAVHLICSFIFINIFHMGVAGSALSFVVARLIGVVGAWIWLFYFRNSIQLKMRHLFKLTKDIQKSIFKLGIPFALEQVFFQGGQLMTQTFITTLPTVSIAANAVGASVYNLYFSTAFSMSTLVLTITGQCIGAGNYDLARKYVRNVIKVGRIVLVGTLLVMIPLTPLILKLYAPTAQAIPLIYQCILIGVLPIPFIWSDAYIIPSALRAAGDASFTTVISLIAMWVARVAIGYFLTITLKIGVTGVWYTITLEWLIRAVIFKIRLKGNKWEKKPV